METNGLFCSKFMVANGKVLDFSTKEGTRRRQTVMRTMKR
jgi:hypothetical protein